MAEPIPTPRRIAYAIGAGGWQITDRIVVSVVVYFYLPAEGRGLETQIPEDVAFGFVTFFGLAMFLGRLFDVAADPIVGHRSDRSRSRLGRRRSFLVYGVGPMVVVPVLLFFPPAPPGSVANVVWLASLLAVYFVFFTMYVGPYLALMPELAWSQRDRVKLGTLVAIASMPFSVLIAVGWPWVFEVGREAGLEPARAMQWTVVGASALALVLCLAPIASVDERRFARSTPSDLPLRRAIALTLRNRPFLVYLLAQMLFVFGVNLIQPLSPYLATVVLGRSEGFAALLGLATLAGVALGFTAIGALTRRFGPKRVMMGCTGVFAVAMSLLGLLEPDVPGGPQDRWNLWLAVSCVGLIGIPIAGVAVLPHVLISQLIDEDETRTGANRSAMFFGVQGLLTKWVYGVALWVFSFLLLRFGKSVEDPDGVLLVGPVGAVACLLALLVWSFYPERSVLAATTVSESA